MRIVGGAFRGRRLTAPKGEVARPTSDRLRQRVFDILEHKSGFALKGAEVADVFAGTGALGLEALSRGASRVTFVETGEASLAALCRNIETLGVGDRAEVRRTDARRLPRREAPFDLVFMDPPYGKGLAAPALESLRSGGWVGPDTLVVLELPEDEPAEFEGYAIADERRQGITKVVFLKISAA